MKERLIGLIKTYVLFVCIFIVQKPLFILYYSSLYADVPTIDILRVIWNGLPLDLSLAGYLTAIPGLLFIASAWTLSSTLRRIWNGYYIFISILLSIIFIVDLGLYEYWGFRLDATPLFYFFSSPKDALASISLWQVLAGVAVIVLCALLFCLILTWMHRRIWNKLKLPYRSLSVSGVLLLCIGLLFIPIRGGFTVSTMNTGKVYFSSNQRLNHAAINPAFSLMESLSKQKDFGSQYRFMDAEQANELMLKLVDPMVIDTTAVVSKELQTTLFNTKRPNVLFVILESFSSRLMTSLGGEPDIAVNLDSLTKEGVLFTNFYSNSFRTDRGLVSVLSGYPAQPSTSIMKYPRKTQNLPAIAGTLRKAGYRTKYYYGGDADFTNMRSYLMSSGFDAILCDQDFAVSERLSKWGAHDHLLFDKLLDDLKAEALDNQKESKSNSNGDATDGMATSAGEPFFKVVQTSSSHEPFEVPYSRLANNRLNAFAYTDSCVGDFVKRFRELPQWENSVIVLVPDHVGAYPEFLDNLSLERYQIPLLLIGGAIAEPKRIDVYGSQHDIAATLLAQLSLPHHEYTFSKDMLNPASPHFAYFTVPNAFGMVTSDNQLIFNCEADALTLDEGVAKGSNLILGKAYLQKLYDDLDNK